jgi:hypothetical protein
MKGEIYMGKYLVGKVERTEDNNTEFHGFAIDGKGAFVAGGLMVVGATVVVRKGKELGKKAYKFISESTPVQNIKSMIKKES